MDKIVIVGASGHARVIIDVVEQDGRYEIAGLVDRDRDVGESMLGYDILGREEDLPLLRERYALGGVIIAIGDNFVRSAVAARVQGSCLGLPFVIARHPSAAIGKDVAIGEGSVIMAGVTINPCCSIGRLCILNTHSSLDHDSSMGDFSSLAPGVTTGGDCRIGNYAAVGSGAVLIHGVGVGEHSVVGAGSLVLKDLESRVVAFGSPARVIRARQAEDAYL